MFCLESALLCEKKSFWRICDWTDKSVWKFCFKKKSLASIAAFCKHRRDSGQQRISMLRAKGEINGGARGWRREHMVLRDSRGRQPRVSCGEQSSLNAFVTVALHGFSEWNMIFTNKKTQNKTHVCVSHGYQSKCRNTRLFLLIFLEVQLPSLENRI